VEKERWRQHNLSGYIVRHITTSGKGQNYGTSQGITFQDDHVEDTTKEASRMIQIKYKLLKSNAIGLGILPAERRWSSPNE
jgi:hypothetical protein